MAEGKLTSAHPRQRRNVAEVARPFVPVHGHAGGDFEFRRQLPGADEGDDRVGEREGLVGAGRIEAVVEAAFAFAAGIA